MKEKKKESNKEENKTVSQELLDSLRSSLYRLKDYLDNIEFNEEDDFNEQTKKVQSILSTGEKLGKIVESLAVLEKKVASEEAIKSKIRGGGDLGMFESQ